MTKYIDADALEESLRRRYCKPCQKASEDNNGVYCRACWVDDTIDEIDLAPAADVVPVVRCADCQYYEKRCPSEDIGWCNRPGAGCGQPKEFYCAGGVRQDGGSVSG